MLCEVWHTHVWNIYVFAVWLNTEMIEHLHLRKHAPPTIFGLIMNCMLADLNVDFEKSSYTNINLIPCSNVSHGCMSTFPAHSPSFVSLYMCSLMIVQLCVCVNSLPRFDPHMIVFCIPANKIDASTLSFSACTYTLKRSDIFIQFCYRCCLTLFSVAVRWNCIYL
jgi:hypothetical protein